MTSFASGSQDRSHGQYRDSLGYDFRFDYDFMDYSKDVSYDGETRGNDVSISNRNERRNGIERKEKYVSLTIISAFKWLLQSEGYKDIHFIFNWTNRKSRIAQKLIKWGVIVERSIIPDDISTLVRSKSKKSRSKSSKSRIRINTSKISTTNQDNSIKEKMENRKKRERILQHVKRLDRDSIQYAVLSQDKNQLRRISKSELSKHIIPSLTPVKKLTLEENPDGIWMLIHGLVFDISNVLDNHPGGVECLLDCTGVDATRVFDDVGHSDIAWEMLQNSVVGVMEEMIFSDDEYEQREFSKGGNLKYIEENSSSNLSNTENELMNTEPENELLKKDHYQLIWSDNAIEYLIFFILSLLGLLTFVTIQRRKWNEV